MKGGCFYKKAQLIMALRKIVYLGDNILRKNCRPVEKFDKRLSILLDDMADTMLAANGVGLAGPQVGVARRVVVVDISGGEGEILEMVNPEIIEMSDEMQTGSEGCLSVPGEFGIVTRPMSVKARYQNRNGEWCEFAAQGLTARAICHECDHLEGKLFIDIMERMLTEEELDSMGESEGDA